MICYRAFGLTFLSDCELPGVNRASEKSSPDYFLKFNAHSNILDAFPLDLTSPFYVSPRRLKRGQPAVEVFRTESYRKFLFRFYDDVVFVIDLDRKQILIDYPPNEPLQAALRHLLFSLPGFLLGLRGSGCLHGAAIGRGNSAIAVLGRSRSGKSILSAEMAVRGLEVLSDDLVALDEISGVVQVYSGYPWISLRSDTLSWLSAGSVGTPLARSKWHYLDDCYITLNLSRSNGVYSSDAKKLEAIYLLMPTNEPHCRPTIEQVAQYRVLTELMDASGRTRIPYRELTSQAFSFLGRLMTSVPVFGLRYHLSKETLAPLMDHLMEAPGLQPGRRTEAS